MFGLRIEKVAAGKPRIPWYSVGWMVLITLCFVWSQWGLSTKTQKIQEAQEALTCHFLKHEHTRLSKEVLSHLPKPIQKHSRRVQTVVDHYYRSHMAREQARHWLQEGDWNRFNLNNLPPGMTCMQFAIRQGQLSQHPKKRLFVAMASHSSAQLSSHQKQLKKLEEAYLQRRKNHPWYGWGLIPSSKNLLPWATSVPIPGGPFNLLFHLFLLWMLAGFLEVAWGQPLWLALYWLGGIFGNILLTLLLSESKQPMLGSSLALATVVGMWSFATFRRTLHFWSQPALPAPVSRFLLAPSWLITVGWIAVSSLDTYLLGYPALPYLLTQLVCFAIGAGTAFAFVSFDMVAELPRPRPAIPSKQEGPRARSTMPTFRKPEPQTGSKKVLQRADLREIVKKSYQEKHYSEAVDGFRELYRKGQAHLEDFDLLFAACEKGKLPPKPDDFLRAIRAAAFAKNQDKARAYYYRFGSKRSQMQWSERDQLRLAQELKRAGLFQDAIRELDAMLEESSDDTFRMDALIVKTEAFLEEGEDLEAPSRLIYQLELFLPENPTYEKSVQRLRLTLSKAEGDSTPETQSASQKLGGSNLLPVSQQGQENTDLLENFDLFEQKLKEAETKDNDGSWYELPYLLLRDQEPTQDTDGTEQPKEAEDDAYLLGDDEDWRATSHELGLPPLDDAPEGYYDSWNDENPSLSEESESASPEPPGSSNASESHSSSPDSGDVLQGSLEPPTSEAGVEFTEIPKTTSPLASDLEWTPELDLELPSSSLPLDSLSAEMTPEQEPSPSSLGSQPSEEEETFDFNPPETSSDFNPPETSSDFNPPETSSEPLLDPNSLDTHALNQPLMSRLILPGSLPKELEHKATLPSTSSVSSLGSPDPQETLTDLHETSTEPLQDESLELSTSREQDEDGAASHSTPSPFEPDNVSPEAPTTTLPILELTEVVQDDDND